MTDDDRLILSTLWLPSRQQEAVAASLGMSTVAVARRGLALLSDPDAERDEPVLVHQARRVMGARRHAR